MNGVCGTNLGTFRTFRAAITPFVRHFGLHEGCRVTRRAQHLIGTYRYAQLASGAVLCHIDRTQRSRRGDGCGAFGNFFVFDDSQSAIYFFLLGFQQGGGGQQSGEREERSSRMVTPLFVGSQTGLFGFMPGDIAYGTLRAFFDTVHTYHAAAVIDGVIFSVDTRGFAITGTRLAPVASGRIDNGTE